MFYYKSKMHAAEILTPSKTKSYWFNLLMENRQSLFWHRHFFFISNFQSQCSLTILVTTSNGQCTVQYILEHTVQENEAKYLKITLKGS